MRTSLTLFFLLSYSMIFSQDINSKAYQIMLKGLLSHSVDKISPKEAYADSNIIYIDSREPEEFAVSKIENAINVGYDNLKLKAVKKLPKESKIVVYCSVGYRSEKVAEKILGLGFSEVYNLYGGIFEWKNQGFPVVNENNVEIDSVHAYNRVWGIWLEKGTKVY